VLLNKAHFNPVVLLRSTLSAEDVNSINSGACPAHLLPFLEAAVRALDEIDRSTEW
jgi:hypothetical protein